MGFRSYYFVRRLYVRNYGPALIRSRLSIVKIVFSSAERPDRLAVTQTQFQ
jgi:2-succinyl-5-enolpyruvyl-6-hydroxy-3-cyclohexene-1-carboxylate synthase